MATNDSMTSVVMFVYNDCRNDARVLREAASLAATGRDVTIVARPIDPASTSIDRERRDGFTIVRVPVDPRSRTVGLWLRSPWRLRSVWQTGLRARLHALPRSGLDLVGWAAIGFASLPWLAVRLAVHAVTKRRARGRQPRRSGFDWVVWWRTSVLGWARAAAAAAPRADVYHGHDLSGLEAAARARSRHGGLLILDSHEIFVEAGSTATQSRIVKAMLARRERSLARRAAALITVNASLARELDRRLRLTRIVVVHNAPARWDVPVPRPDLIRAATGIPAEASIALYHGGFAAHRGLEQLVRALAEPGMERVHAVFLGYGALRGMLDEAARAHALHGRIHVLDAVPPADLEPWVASADVGVCAIQPSTMNHRLSTPNKLFESLTAGLPVVVSDFAEMRAIVLDDPLGPLGEVCQPDDPADVARAIEAILNRPGPEREELRARCAAAAHARWNWETEVGGLLALYDDLGRAG